MQKFVLGDIVLLLLAAGVGQGAEPLSADFAKRRDQILPNRGRTVLPQDRLAHVRPARPCRCPEDRTSRS